MVEVKGCGITRGSDAQEAVSLGATAIGFVFWQKSQRYVTPDVAAAITRELPSVRTVGVFVNSSVEEVHKVADIVGLSSVQLHGDESDDIYIKEIKLNKSLKLSNPKNIVSWKMLNLNNQNFIGHPYASGMQNIFLKKKIGKDKFSIKKSWPILSSVPLGLLVIKR